MTSLFSLIPALFLLVLFTCVQTAKRLGFLSRQARHLDQVDIPNEVREIRLENLAMLLSEELDHEATKSDLHPLQRRLIVNKRFRELRKTLYLIIDNAGVFRDVARFHLLYQYPDEPELEPDPEELAFAAHISGRAFAVQVLAAVCLGKLLLLDLRRIVQPSYSPNLAGRFRLRNLDLISWYRHMANSMLSFTAKYYDEDLYTRFILQLTGVFKIETARELNRL